MNKQARTFLIYTGILICIIGIAFTKPVNGAMTNITDNEILTDKLTSPSIYMTGTHLGGLFIGIGNATGNTSAEILTAVSGLFIDVNNATGNTSAEIITAVSGLFLDVNNATGNTSTEILTVIEASHYYNFTYEIGWQNLTTYPTACSAGTPYVGGVDDTLTCITPTGNTSAEILTAVSGLFLDVNNETGNTTAEIMAAVNVSNIDTTGNITTSDYFFGTTIEGNIGSGVIWCDEVDSSGSVNLTHIFGETELRYPNMTVRLVKTDNTVKYCNITSAWVTPTDDQHSVYYIDSNCAVQSATFANYIETDLSPGGLADIFNVMRHDGEIEVGKGVMLKNKEDINLRKTALSSQHLRTISGLGITTETFPNYTIAEGEYIYDAQIVNSSEQNITRGDIVEIVYRVGGTWTYAETQLGINLTDCDDGVDTAPCSTPTKYRRVFIFMSGFADGHDHTKLHQLLADEDITYVSVGDCLNTDATPLTFTIPPVYEYAGVTIWAYCGRASDSAWTGSFIDMRAVQVGSASTDIDTSIFLTVDGTRPLTAIWNYGPFNLNGSGGFNTSDSVNASIFYENGVKINDTASTYARAVNFTMDAYVDEWHLAQNNTISAYARAYADAMDIINNNSIIFYSDTNDTLYNASMVSYCDSQDVIYNNSVVFYSDTNDTLYNASMVSYCDSQDVINNNSLIFYSDTNDTLYNASMVSYCDSQDDAFNTSMGTNVLGVNETMREYVLGVNETMRIYSDESDSTNTSEEMGAAINRTNFETPFNLTTTDTVIANITDGGFNFDIYWNGTCAMIEKRGGNYIAVC